MTRDDLLHAIAVMEDNAVGQDEDMVEQQHLHGPGVDVDRRCIYLVGDMGYAAMEHLATSLELLECCGTDPIRVRIYSTGGYAVVGLSMYDLLQSSTCTIVTEVLAHVASTAVLAYLGGDERLVRPHSTMMVHGTRAQGEGSRVLLGSHMESMQWFDDRAADLLGERTKRGRRYWAQLLDNGRDHAFNGGEALLAVGLGTELVK